jgi:hypothetical protein
MKISERTLKIYSFLFFALKLGYHYQKEVLKGVWQQATI